MVFPPQTSLIPAQIALARFLEQGGPSASSGLYPYWYLGTTPFRFLTGPVLPLVLVGLHKILSFISLFELIFLLITVSWTLGAAGIYLLVKELGGERKTAVLSALFYFFGPIVPLLFRFSDGLYLITFSFLPTTLLLYLRLLRNWSRKRVVILVLAITFLMLLDTVIIPTLLLGMAAIFLATISWGKIEEKLHQTLLISAICFLVSTLWYTPTYWLTLLGAPSLAGKGLVSVVVWLGKLLPTALALTIAVFSVKFFKKRNKLLDFCFYWLAIFGFLTLIRFLSDPDFWLDWSAYGTELQMGIALALGLIIQKIKFKTRVVAIFTTFYLLLFTFIFSRYVLGTLQWDITKTVEYRIGEKLSEIVKPDECVFLSGTTAFWLNAFFDIPQVRGGRDQAAVHPTWRAAVWEVREGPSTSSGQENALEWLKKLGVDYLVVHTKNSSEFYHDFVNPEKFEETSGFKKIYEEKGDRIYQVL